MRRKISYAVCAMLLTQMLMGCQNTDDAEKRTEALQTKEISSADAAAAVAEPVYESDDLPDTLDFGGRTVNTFGWTGPANPEFFVEANNGDIVNDAIFQRNLTVEERLNVELAYHLEPGAYMDLNAWINHVSKAVLSGAGAYDIVADYSMGTATLAQKRLLTDLNALKYLNFDKPWWSSSLKTEAAVGDKLYFCSGDIATSMIYNLFAVYFNKDIIKEYHFEDPYQMVTKGTWTIDKMHEMSSAVSADLNGNNQWDADDKYGFALQAVYSDSLFYGIGLRTTERNADGIPEISKLFGSEKAADFLAFQVDWYEEPSVYSGYKMETYDEIYKMFAEGRALFTISEFEYSVNWLRDAQIGYGIVPVPKYDEAQQSYYSVMSFPYSLYAVPMDAKEPDISAAVLECMASESYRTVSPMLFEVGYKVKYAPDDEAAKMFDLIRSSAVYDFGRIFSNSLNSMTFAKYRDSVATGHADWMSTYASMEKSLNKKLDKLVEKLLEEE